MTMVRNFFVLSVVFVISACSTGGEEKPEYLGSSGLQGLEVPPQLTRPDASNEMVIPEPSARVLKELQSSNKVKGSVAPEFKDVRLTSSEGIYWLEMEQDADSLWSLLQDFFAHEGIKIYREEPLLGFIESDWLKEYEAVSKDAGMLSNLFSKFSPDVLDKFRLRLERMPDAKGTRIYASHRGLEKNLLAEGTAWVARPSEPMLEREILYRLVLFLGANKLQADNIFAGYIPYQPRIKKLGEEGSVYEVIGKPDFVWQRLILAMDRLGAEISRQDKNSGQLDVLVSTIPEKLQVEEDPEAEASWLSRALQGDDEIQTPESGKLAVFLTLKPSGQNTQLDMKLSNGVEIKAGLADKFRQSLVALLK